MSDSKDVKRRCAKCHILAQDHKNVRFHRFPLPGKHGSLKARVWAMYCYPDKDWTTDESLTLLYQQHKMLCSHHFDNSSYTSSEMTRLNKFAIPIGAKHILNKLRLNQSENTENPQQAVRDLARDTGSSTSQIVYDHFNPSVLSASKQAVTDQEENTGPSTSQIDNDQLNQSVLSESKGIKSRGILQEIGISKTCELTPKKRKLYNRCRRNLAEIIRLRKKIKKKPCDILKALSTDENVQNLFKSNVTGSFALMLQNQLKNTPRKLYGRRWSINDKILALSMYKKSASCYRLLKRLFCLPSEGTLKKLLNKIPLKCGINSQIFESVKKLTSSRQPEQNLCILSFDEMSIKKHLTYNIKQDIIDGFQDHGRQGRSRQPATHALLFMATGLRTKWKQPLVFYFSGDSVTADRLSVLIKEVLEACFDAGLIVCATVCDNFGVNIKALNSLGSTVDKPYFNFKGEEIVTILDPPHLLKCFRNNFMKHNIEVNQEIEVNGKIIKGVAEWNHIRAFYEKDNKNPNFVFAPALTKQHIDPNFKQKMKVRLASQVLSHSVAAGMFAMIATNDLPPEATTTATLVGKMDSLFDSFNGDTPDRKRGKPYLTNYTKTSPHSKLFEEMKNFFREIKFIGMKSRPPSQDGFIRTIKAIEHLLQALQNKFNIKSISTRRLNQDPLENCFGCIRSNCGSNPNPNTVQFVAALKSAMIGNLINSTKNKNCLNDDNKILENLRFLLDQTIESTPMPTRDVNVFCDLSKNIDLAEDLAQCSGEMQACAYVSGFIVKKIASSCDPCMGIMLAEENTELSHIFTSFKEYNHLKSSLNYVSKNFTTTVENAATMINSYLNDHGYAADIKSNCLNILKENLNFEWLLGCAEHYEDNVNSILTATFFICIKRFCNIKNRDFIDTRSINRKLNILKNV